MCVTARERERNACSDENRVHTRLSEKSFRTEQSGGRRGVRRGGRGSRGEENPFSGREGAQQPSRYCSAASKLRRVHRLHTMRVSAWQKHTYRATVYSARIREIVKVHKPACISPLFLSNMKYSYSKGTSEKCKSL